MFELPSRGLIIRQPWIELILSGKKTWEMRSRPTSVRGRIALIESGTRMVVGECWIVHSSNNPVSHQEARDTINQHHVCDISLLEKWCFAWELKFAKRYKKPIPYTHPMGAVVWVDLKKLERVG